MSAADQERLDRLDLIEEFERAISRIRSATGVDGNPGEVIHSGVDSGKARSSLHWIRNIRNRAAHPEDSGPPSAQEVRDARARLKAVMHDLGYAEAETPRTPASATPAAERERTPFRASRYGDGGSAHLDDARRAIPGMSRRQAEEATMRYLQDRQAEREAREQALGSALIVPEARRNAEQVKLIEEGRKAQQLLISKHRDSKVSRLRSAPIIWAPIMAAGLLHLWAGITFLMNAGRPQGFFEKVIGGLIGLLGAGGYAVAGICLLLIPMSEGIPKRIGLLAPMWILYALMNNNWGEGPARLWHLSICIATSLLALVNSDMRFRREVPPQSVESYFESLRAQAHLREEPIADAPRPAAGRAPAEAAKDTQIPKVPASTMPEPQEPRMKEEMGATARTEKVKFTTRITHPRKDGQA